MKNTKNVSGIIQLHDNFCGPRFLSIKIVLSQGRPFPGGPVVEVAYSDQIFGNERVALKRSPSVVNLSFPF
jgi:hypothetical protein